METNEIRDTRIERERQEDTCNQTTSDSRDKHIKRSRGTRRETAKESVPVVQSMKRVHEPQAMPTQHDVRGSAEPTIALQAVDTYEYDEDAGSGAYE